MVVIVEELFREASYSHCRSSTLPRFQFSFTVAARSLLLYILRCGHSLLSYVSCLVPNLNRNQRSICVGWPNSGIELRQWYLSGTVCSHLSSASPKSSLFHSGEYNLNNKRHNEWMVSPANVQHTAMGLPCWPSKKPPCTLCTRLWRLWSNACRVRRA